MYFQNRIPAQTSISSQKTELQTAEPKPTHSFISITTHARPFTLSLCSSQEMESAYLKEKQGGAIMRSPEQCQSIVIGSRKDRNFSIAKEILVCVLFFCLFSFLSLFYREDLQVSTITLSYYWDIFLALHTTDAATRASSFQKVRSWVVKSCYYSTVFVLVWRIFIMILSIKMGRHSMVTQCKLFWTISWGSNARTPQYCILQT